MSAISRERNALTASSPLKPADAVCSAAFAVLVSLSVALVTGKVNPMVLDFTGVAFLVAAFTYRGSVRHWWMWLMPLALGALIAPLAVWESMGKIETPLEIFRLAALPALSLIGGGMLATFRDTVRTALDGRESIAALRAKIRHRAMELERLDGEVLNVISWVSETAPGGRRAPAWESVEIRIDELELFREGPLETISHDDLDTLIRSELDRLSDFLRMRPKIKLSFASQRRSPVLVAMLGRRDAMAAVVRTLIGQAIAGLVANEGLIRVSLRPTLRSIAIVFEDNGRGLNEAIINRLDEKGVFERPVGLLKFREARKLIERMGGRIDLHARLGAGSRIAMEFPRVDAYALSGASIGRTVLPIGSSHQDAEMSSKTHEFQH